MISPTWPISSPTHARSFPLKKKRKELCLCLVSVNKSLKDFRLPSTHGMITPPIPLSINMVQGCDAVYAALEAATCPQSLLFVTYVVVSAPLCREVLQDARVRAQSKCAAACAALRKVLRDK